MQSRYLVGRDTDGEKKDPSIGDSGGVFDGDPSHPRGTPGASIWALDIVPGAFAWRRGLRFYIFRVLYPGAYRQ